MAGEVGDEVVDVVGFTDGDSVGYIGGFVGIIDGSLVGPYDGDGVGSDVVPPNAIH